MNKYRKALFSTNDKSYPTLFLLDTGKYILVDENGNLTGDAFLSKEEVLKYFPKADLN